MKVYIASVGLALMVSLTGISEPVIEIKDYEPIDRIDRLTFKRFKAHKPAKAKYVKPINDSNGQSHRGGSEAKAKAFIYQHESGNRLDAVNDGGCYGLGQDCNNVLAGQCPDWRTDRKCQDKFWEAYMKRRYGTWRKAKAHWLARVPINGVDVGNWW